jgi:tetratricopeptide (TPR) repeat protein
LLTPEGSPKIADFGLAKQLDDPAAHTQSGALVGTPSYMAPEQAVGNRTLMGPAVDVYGLGAVLYESVTGRPPFRSDTVLETLRLVESQEPVAPRQLVPKLPRDLETICLKCLRKEPARRYLTALALADDLRRFQAGEPVRARPVSRAERLGRWCRRKPLTAALLITVVLTLACGIIAVEYQRRQTAWERDQTALERDRKDSALQAEAQARSLAVSALRKLTDSVLEEQLARRTALTDEDRRFLREIQRQYEQFAVLPGDEVEQRAIRAEGYSRIGLVRHRLGEEREAEAAYGEAVAQYRLLAAEFPTRLEFGQQLAKNQNNLGALLWATGRPREGEASLGEALALYKQLAVDFPSRPEFRQELAKNHNNLGRLLSATGRLPEAEAAYADALALTRQLVADFPSRPEFRQDLANSHNNLGALFQHTGRPEEAEAAYAGALALYKQLAADFPSRPDFRQNLAMSQNNLGMLFKHTGRSEEAEAAYAGAIALYKQLAADFPSRPDFRRNLAMSLNNLGILLSDTGRLREAEAAHTDALTLQKQLAADFPSRPEYRQEIAKNHTNLGLLLCAMGRVREAEAAYADALTLQKQLAADFPERPALRDELALSHLNLGLLLYRSGRLKEAEAAYGNALALYKQLAADFPGTPDYRNGLATTLGSLALVANQRRDFAQAQRYLQEAEPHHQAALRANLRDPDYRLFYQNSLGALVVTSAGLGDRAAAVQAAVRRRDLGWDPPGDAFGAASALALCVPIVEKDDQRSEEERAQQARFYADQAMGMLRDAVAKGHKDVAHMKQDADLDPLRNRDDFRKLVAELEGKASELSPKPGSANRETEERVERLRLAVAMISAWPAVR